MFLIDEHAAYNSILVNEETGCVVKRWWSTAGVNPAWELCETISAMTGRDQTLLDQRIVVAKLNRVMIGWANYFCLGPVSKAYRAVDEHACNRLRQWLCAKHKVMSTGLRRFSVAFLHERLGLVRLTERTSSFPWATS